MAAIISAEKYDRQSERSEAFEQSLARDPQAPIALILTSKYDPNRALFPAAPSTQFLVHSLKQTHQIAHQIIMKKSDIRLAIRSLPADRIKLLILDSHGNGRRLKIDREEIYGMEDVTPEDFEGLSDDAEIYLLACRTGNGLAQKIADISDRTVFAPMKNIYPYSTCRSYCQTHHRWEIRSYKYKQQHIVQFSKNNAPLLCECSQTSDDVYFSKLKLYLADQHTSAAHSDLAFIYKNAGDLQKAKRHFQEASDLGDIDALNSLGIICEDEGDTKNAEIYYQRAIDLGHDHASFNLSLLYKKKATRIHQIIKTSLLVCGVLASCAWCFLAQRYGSREGY